MQYDPLSGSGTNDSEARIRELESDGIHRELAFPNALLGLMGWPDTAVRELCFRVYNEHIAELQERSNGRFYGVGLINWWGGEGARNTLAAVKGLGLTTLDRQLAVAGTSGSGRVNSGGSPRLKKK